MHCDQCGNQNRLTSKFCRHCGSTFDNVISKLSGKRQSHSAITWRSPIVIILVTLIIIAGLIYGGTKAYTYYQIESRMNSAIKLQANNDFDASINVLSELENKTLTVNQKNKVESIKADNQKFIEYRTSFDNAIAIQNSTSTTNVSLSANLQTALTELQSIESSYPDFKKVQAEMTKIQNALVTVLHEEAQISKKAAADAKALAEKNRVAAATARAARDRAEQNAQQAESNAQAQANIAQGEEVKRSFRNELTISYNSYLQAFKLYGSAIQYSNANNPLLALAQSNSAHSVLTSAYSAVNDLNDRYTGLTTTYYSASNNMLLAIGYLSKALELLIDSEGTSLDYSSSINSNKNSAQYYVELVSLFLNANYR